MRSRSLPALTGRSSADSREGELQMLVGDVCTRKVIVASRGTSIFEAAKLMREHHTGDVVVTDDFDGRRVPVGIVTDRDIVIGVLAQQLNPTGLTLGEIM